MRLDRPRAQLLARRLDPLGRQPVGLEFEHEELVEQPALRALAEQLAAVARGVHRELEGEGVAKLVEITVEAAGTGGASPRNAIERSRLTPCLILELRERGDQPPAGLALDDRRA